MNGAILMLAMASSAPGAVALPQAEVGRWGVLIAMASARYGIPAQWIARVMREESGGRTQLLGRPIRSHMGAIGLMQLMPETWREMRHRYALGRDPDDPHDNIMAGTAYLRLMYDRFGYPAMFGAYNAGPARYAAYLQGRAPLPAQTEDYVRAVTGAVHRTPTPPAFQTIFFALRTVPAADAPPMRPRQNASLFIVTQARPIGD